MLYEQIEKNKRDTKIIVTAFVLVTVLTGALVGELLLGSPTLGAIVTGIIVYFYIKIAMSNQQTILAESQGYELVEDDAQYPELYNIVQELSIAGQIPTPSIYISSDPIPNAFAFGFTPDKAYVGVTQGLLEQLNREELTAVMAHEIAHIANYDTRLKTMALLLGSVLLLLMRLSFRTRVSIGDSDSKGSGLAIIFTGVVFALASGTVYLLRQKLSRNREYLADSTAIDLTRNPEGLKRALLKISQAPKSEQITSSNAFMYFTNPLKQEEIVNEQGEMLIPEPDSFFSTHPSTYNRIQKLNNM